MIQKGRFILFDNINEFHNWIKGIKITRKIKYLQVHHTWKPNYSHFKGNNYFDMCESMKQSHIQRNLGTIAQQITTFPDGKLMYSLDRPFDKTPAGIKGANGDGICIENIGNFDSGGDKINSIQRDCIVKLYAILANKLNLPIDTEHIVYHHWFSSSGSKVYDFKTGRKLASNSAKSCPGTAFWGVGNTVTDAQKSFIPDVQRAYNELFLDRRGEQNPLNTYKYNTVYKERVYASNGKLIRVADGNYNIKATDVRFIKFEKGKNKFEFISQKGAKVSTLSKNRNADFGFNLPFFDFSAQIVVGTVWDGVQKKYINGAWGDMVNWHEIGFKDGSVEIGKFTKEQREKMDFSVQGKVLIENGKMVWKNDGQRCQRTFIGVDANGDILLGIGDGRNEPYDQGLTCEEMALFMKEKGAVWAIEGDGGGSTILTQNGKGINQAKNRDGNERVVHHAVLVYLGALNKPSQPTPNPDPAPTPNPTYKDSDPITYGDLKKLGLIK